VAGTGLMFSLDGPELDGPLFVKIMTISVTAN